MKKIRQEIRAIMNVQHNIIEIIEGIRLRSFGHLKRMGSDRIPEIIVE